MEIKNFTELKESFYARVKDIHVFNSGEINLVKVVLDGLKVDYEQKKIRHIELFESRLKTNFKNYFRKVKYSAEIKKAKKQLNTLLKKKNIDCLLFDSTDRTIPINNENVSYYFHNIRTYFKNSHVLTVGGRKNLSVITEKDIEFCYKYSNLTSEEKTTKKNLIAAYNKIYSEEWFTKYELQNIKTAFSLFFAQYKTWNSFLKNFKIEKSFFICHYHKEGFILALKRHNIKAIELQHGLIAPEDIFYMMPETIKSISKKALFPDIFLSYGAYWTQRLLQGYEFRKEQILEIGLYQVIKKDISDRDLKTLKDFTKGNSFILITTQTFIHDFFIAYINWLSSDLLKKKSNYQIIVKTHPSENIALYETLKNLTNVRILNFNLEYLLKTCVIHISVYSTTLYEALKYSCRNYSLHYEPLQYYVDSFIKEGISELLYPNQNPLDFSGNKTVHSFDPGYFFSNFDEKKTILGTL